jgi:hypothetical protein
MELTDMGSLRILSKESSDTKKNRGKTCGRVVKRMAE